MPSSTRRNSRSRASTRRRNLLANELAEAMPFGNPLKYGRRIIASNKGSNSKHYTSPAASKSRNRGAQNRTRK